MPTQLRPGWTAIFGISIVVFLAACSGSTSTAPSAVAQSTAAPASIAASSDAGGPASSDDGGEACTIVTKDAVSQAMGFPVALVSGAGLICIFQTADSSHNLAITLYHSQADMGLMLQIEPGSDHVAGLGDDAFFAGGEILFVRQGDHAIEILDADYFGSAVGSAPRDALIALARAALPKL